MKIFITIIMTFLGSNILDDHGINLPNMRVNRAVFYNLERQSDLVGRQWQTAIHQMERRVNGISYSIRSAVN